MNSLRVRVLTSILFIVTMALALNYALVVERLYDDARDAAEQELQHEAVKFQSFAAEGKNPKTGMPYSSAGALLTRYLTDIVPETNEAMFSVVNGKPAERTRMTEDYGPRLDLDPEIVKQAAEVSSPYSGTINSPEGPICYAIIPVASGDSTPNGALVIVEYLAGAHDDIRELSTLLGLVSLLAWVLVAVSSYFIAGRIVSPLRRMRKAAEAIGEDDLTSRIAVLPESSNDDLAALQHTLNKMLDRLESAFVSQRNFLDDAAHELRTPLTVIRGQLEISDTEPEQRALLLDEVDRMSRIVDDVLTLAKAKRPDFLSLSEVDLTDLVVSVLAKASPLAQRAWDIPQVAPCAILADRQRLTQALMQLISNAISVTENGDVIAVSSTVHDGRVFLEVSDSGPGVPEPERATIFERFESGSRSRPDSSGLGLAIVCSIAQAHGGFATVSDAPQGGAQFIISFPIKEVADASNTNR